MSGLYENVRKDRKKGKDRKIWIALTVLVCAIAIVIASVVWFLGYHGRFTDFVSKLSASTTYANKTGGLIATVNGKTYRVSEENMYGIFAYISLNKSGRESKKVPEGEPVTLDYGNGMMLKLWDYPVDRHHYLFLQYTDINGDVYSYISFKTTLETVVVRYLTYGNEEIT